MRIPAVITASAASALKVASLTVLDRLIVAVHRGGAGAITLVCNGPLPELKRTRALAIPIRVETEPPKLIESVLLANGNVLVHARDVRRCIESGGRLTLRNGSLLPIGIASSATMEVDIALLGLPATPVEGVAAVVVDGTSARAAERELWASLGSSADGFVDKVFNRPCGRPLSKILISTPVTPNMVSIASVLIGVLSALFFADGSAKAILIGAILFQLSAIIDCVDGDIARVVFKESPLGKWIDIVGDQLVHVSVFAGIALGVWRAGDNPEALWLGASAMAGAVISFAVVLRGMREGPAGNRPLQRLIDAATNRDFSVVVLLLACFQKLEIFLWLAAIGSHLFWMAAFSLQLAFRPARPLQG